MATRLMYGAVFSYGKFANKYYSKRI